MRLLTTYQWADGTCSNDAHFDYSECGYAQYTEDGTGIATHIDKTTVPDNWKPIKHDKSFMKRGRECN